MRTPRRRTKVCFLIGGREGGGAAASTLNLIRQIDESEFDVSILACEDGPYTARVRGIGKRCDVLGTGWPPMLRRRTSGGIRSRWRGYCELPLWLFRTVFWVIGHMRREQIELVHTNYHHFHVVAGIACVLAGRKCVWHWRGQLEQGAEQLTKDVLRNMTPRLSLRDAIVRRLGPLVRLACRDSVWSVANSNATYRSVRPIAHNRMSVVYNGVALDSVPAQPGRLRRMLSLGAGTHLVGMVASLNPRKGHGYFIEAAARVCARLNDVRFVQIGGETAAGQQAYRQALVQRIQSLSLQDRLQLLGHQDEASDLAAELDIATVCTLPPGEGFGLVIIEAMAQAVPVVATDCGAAREIIEHGVTGILVPPANVPALAAAIEELLENEVKRRQIGEAGQRMCRERFDLQRTVRQVEAVYRMLLNRGADRRGKVE